MAKYKFNIKCGAKLTSVEIEADTYEDALKEVKKQALRYKGEKVDTKFDKNKLDTRDYSAPVKGNYFLKGDKVDYNGRKGVVKNAYGDVVVVQLEGDPKGDYSHLSYYTVKHVKDANEFVKYFAVVTNKKTGEQKSVAEHDRRKLDSTVLFALKQWGWDKKDVDIKYSITKDAEVAWQEFNSSDRVVTKRKEFKDKESRDKFINKLVEKDNFYTILGTRDSDVEFEAAVDVAYKLGKIHGFDREKITRLIVSSNAFKGKKVNTFAAVTEALNRAKKEGKQVKDALPITYSIKVSEYKGKLKIDVENEYWDSSDYAFYDGQKIYSYSKNAADFVKKALNDLKIDPKSLKVGQKIRQKVKDAKFGLHLIKYIDVDGKEQNEYIKGYPADVDKRVKDLKNHDCKLLKQQYYVNWNKDAKVFYVKYVDLKSDNGKELIKYFKDVKEAKNFVDLDGKDIIIKASNITTKDSKPFKVDKVIMHEKDANGKMLYLVKSDNFYVTTVDPTGRGGGIFDLNLKNAQETFKSNILMAKLEKKYGKQEGRKKYLAGATDASVSVYTDPWSWENGGKQPKGYGHWAFAYTRRPDIKDVFFFAGNYADCKKKAIEKAKSEGKTAIYVLS